MGRPSFLLMFCRLLRVVFTSAPQRRGSKLGQQ